MWIRNLFSVAAYEVIDGRYVKVVWKCNFCDEKFKTYDPPIEHSEECLAYLVNKI